MAWREKTRPKSKNKVHWNIRNASDEFYLRF